MWIVKLSILITLDLVLVRAETSKTKAELDTLIATGMESGNIELKDMTIGGNQGMDFLCTFKTNNILSELDQVTPNMYQYSLKGLEMDCNGRYNLDTKTIHSSSNDQAPRSE